MMYSRMLAGVLAPVLGAAALSGCITSPEEQEALREAEYAEQLRLQRMIEAGECSERPMTGQRTRTVYECGDENADMVDAARESMRRIQRQGGLARDGGNGSCTSANC